jgi:antitoxin (DNA-binding transcriptional repressor) of toxin-antitoxin stability system
MSPEPLRMKSDEARQAWRDVLDRAKRGESTVVEHYNRAVARVIPEDDAVVILRTSDPVQAERLRRLVRDYHSVGIPFPNNDGSGRRVVEENGDPTGRHSVPSVDVEII